MQQNQIGLILLCCRQRNPPSKTLQNKVILLWEALKHFHAIYKKYAFVAVAQENRPVSPNDYNSSALYFNETHKLFYLHCSCKNLRIIKLGEFKRG